MKKTLLLMTIFINCLFAQPQNYFVKFYSGFENSQIIQVLEHSVGYYLIVSAGDYTDQISDIIAVIKTDWEGNVLWETIPYSGRILYSSKAKPAYLTVSEDKLLLATGKGSPSEYVGGALISLDKDGNSQTTIFNHLSWNYVLGKRSTSVTVKSNGNYLVVLQSDTLDLELVEINTDNEVVWIKNLPGGDSTGTANSQILSFEDSNYVVRSESRIVKVNQGGDVLWQFNPDYEIQSMIINDEKNIAAVSRTNEDSCILTKLDADGVVLLEKTLEGNWGLENIVLGLNQEGNYTICHANKIIEFDTDGNNIATFTENEEGDINFTFVNRGSHNDMLLGADYYSLFTVTDSTYHSEIIKVTNSILYQKVSPMKLSVYWASYNVSQVDIYYSIDEGITWEEFVTSYPANQFYYNTYIPYNIESDNIIVRVQNSDNPATNDQTTLSIDSSSYEHYDYIAANEVLMWVGNNGDGSHDPRTDGSGFYWPGGEDATIPAIFEDGLIYGGKLNEEIRVNGNTHNQGLVPGIVLSNGNPDNPAKPEYKVFKYKKGWENLNEGPEKDKLSDNVQNWPVELGAPFVDKDFDGLYTPDVDEPGNGADEFLFNVSNGADAGASAYTYGSPPLPIELHISAFGYDRDDELENVVFKKYKIINKGEEPLTDFYLSYWSDDDLGDAGDDFVGCDTTLSMMFTYNGDENDDPYGSPPPAVAHMFVQGPIVPGEPGDVAYFNYKQKRGYRNLPMTSYTFYIGASVIYRDPQQGVYEGTLEIYNYMQGQFWNGSDIIDPNTNKSTRYALAGDPVAGIGWYEGDGWPNGPAPDDRRSLMSSGPFELAAGDTQEVVLAIFMARGTDRLNSITELRNTAEKVNEFFYDELTDVKKEETLPNKIELTQNYPNPFNPSTKIKFSIPGVETTWRVVSTKLVVYDILGREIKTLLNKKLTPGRYEVEFEGSNLSSGVYFYRLQVGDIHIVKKMMLLK